MIILVTFVCSLSIITVSIFESTASIFHPQLKLQTRVALKKKKKKNTHTTKTHTARPLKPTINQITLNWRLGNG
jgi:hypothetical protein